MSNLLAKFTSCCFRQRQTMRGDGKLHVKSHPMQVNAGQVLGASHVDPIIWKRLLVVGIGIPYPFQRTISKRTISTLGNRYRSVEYKLGFFIYLEVDTTSLACVAQPLALLAIGRPNTVTASMDLHSAFHFVTIPIPGVACTPNQFVLYRGELRSR